MGQLLFRDEAGFPRPVRGDKADGVTTFALADASERFHLGEDELKSLWFKEFMCEGDNAGEISRAIDANTPDLELLRQMRYPDLSRSQISYLHRFCERRGLSLWAKHVEAKPQWDEHSRRMKLEIIVCIEAIRLIAHRTREYAGCDAGKWDYADDEKIPAKCSVTIYRMVNGVRQPYTGSALWEEFAPIAQTSLAARMPHNYLERCAEIQAIRKAFPDEMARLCDQADGVAA